MRVPSMTARLLLALCLLFSQQVLVAHAVTHTAKAASQQDSTPGHGKVCETCVLSAQLNDALLGQIDLLLDARAHALAAAVAVNTYLPQATRSYRSRAPPALS